MESEWQRFVIEPIEELLVRWQERRDTELLQTLVPAWRANTGLTDGWQDVLVALDVTARTLLLPPDKADILRSVASRIEQAVAPR